jgi:hypothetical protein
MTAPWAARTGHTTVIDAAGAIYVLGGLGGFHNGTFTRYNDVHVSTDGGAGPDSRRGWSGVLGGYSKVLHRYYTGSMGK